MKRIFVLVIGVCGVLIGLGLVMPAVAQIRDTGALPALGVGLLLLGLLLMLCGGGAVYYGGRRSGAFRGAR